MDEWEKSEERKKKREDDNVDSTESNVYVWPQKAGDVIARPFEAFSSEYVRPSVCLRSSAFVFIAVACLLVRCACARSSSVLLVSLFATDHRRCGIG